MYSSIAADGREVKKAKEVSKSVVKSIRQGICWCLVLCKNNET